MSIYRSQAGKAKLLAAYDDAVDRLDVEVDERRFETRHGSTHLLVAGPPDGPPVIVFHGGNATNPMTLAWYTGLADDYRLIAPDTIGQPGKSAETRVNPNRSGYGEWTVDILDALEIPSASMIGTSYGGGIILRTAAVAPERIDRAALVVPAGFGTGSLVSMLQVGLPAVLYRLVPRDRLLDRVCSAMVTRPSANPVVRDTIAASLRYVDLERTFPQATAAELERFTAPVMLVVAENDPFFPPEEIVPRARDRLPSLSRVERIPGEKHILSPAAQERVTDVIREFYSG
ncbi:alpha/beta fold hydrolase [Natrialba taiwanensis]|uniref:Alpha/beta hydrolase n=1 Tax=Natrialba taiwanensis DSM 12281 TaxID=1230458 RepID=L9ZH20_9EURY|nr:alpha/beta hydrolase [Natrialba taiwanensis]ELY85639.1 alpha/beta hydrolase [Natrialba taiwanensis DSM 12281]